MLGTDRVEGVEVVRNELVEENGRIVARPTGEHETIEAGLVFRSVGYQGVELPGVPFDAARATIPNDQRPRRSAPTARTAPAGSSAARAA